MKRNPSINKKILNKEKHNSALASRNSFSYNLYLEEKKKVSLIRKSGNFL